MPSCAPNTGGVHGPHNFAFMNAELAVRGFIEPALQGLGHKAGALVFQLSPLAAHAVERFARAD